MAKSWNIWVLQYLFRVHFIINPFEIKWYKDYCSGERFVAHGPLVIILTVYLKQNYPFWNMQWHNLLRFCSDLKLIR